MAKRIIIPLLLILVASFTLWFQFLQKTAPTRQNSPVGPDFYLEEFRSVSMDAQGLPKEKLEAKRLTHYPSDGRTDFEQLSLTVVKPKDRYYVVRANTGSLLSGANSLHLLGDVNIRRYAQSKLASQMFTEELWVYSDDNIIRTEKPVRFVDDLGVINAVGIVADMNKQKIELMRQVRGKYYARPQ